MIRLVLQMQIHVCYQLQIRFSHHISLTYSLISDDVSYVYIVP